MILDRKFTISRTGGTMLLTLIDSGAPFNFMSSIVAKHLGWATKPNKTLVEVNLANGTVCSSGSINGLVLSGI